MSNRMSLNEAVAILNSLGYTVGKSTGCYIVESKTGRSILENGHKVVDLAKEKQAKSGVVSQKSGTVSLEEILNESYKEVVDAGVAPAPRENIYVQSYGAQRSWGWCNRVGNKYRIRISERNIDLGRDSVKETMIHEILHTVPGCMNHGPKWKEQASKVNRMYGYNIKRTTSREEKCASAVEETRTFAHKIVCTTCGYEYLRFKRSNLVDHPERYRCQCGGKLKREF